ncbi:MAG TPA: cytochrome c-type biogenesis protein CcmH [Gemmatimonadaceae bacterium]|nr:cytochrome c-type biogenesis protein CcmH [Gemmatimonadaceae bacterium]
MRTRRQFLATVAGAGASVALSGDARAMQTTQSFSGPMEQNAYRPVALAPKQGGTPSMTDKQRDDLEHQIKCQCGCVLDVYTCRTTDFSCSVSPAMHRDVMSLVSGGYDGAEILAAFQSVYGERVLMSPLKRGFNLVGYVMPFVALVTGGVVVAGLIRRWGARAANQVAPAPVTVHATTAELDAVAAALKDDS